jgi:hypothetical protein
MALGGLNRTTQGIYLVENGAVSVVANTTTQIPSGAGNFKLSMDYYEGVPSADNGRIAFAALGDGTQAGIYLSTYAGGLTRVVDATTPVPNDTRNFQTFGSVILDNGRLAFIGNELNRGGVYLHDLATGITTLVADYTVPIPGRPHHFKHFIGGRGIDIDGTRVAFAETSLNRDAGVYLFDSASGEITMLADTLMPVPGGDGSLFAPLFDAVSIDNHHYVIGYGQELLQTQSPGADRFAGLHGVYANLEGSLEKVIAGGDIFEGHRVYSAEIGPESLDGDHIALTIWHSGGEGVYIATLIPEPGTLALAVVAFAFFAVVAYRRSKKPSPCSAHISRGRSLPKCGQWPL